MGLVEEAGLLRQCRLLDMQPASLLRGDEPPLHLQYADNFASFGLERDRVIEETALDRRAC